ncbi:hypothetical protein AB670_00243 [Chryseobacterium sp. MOF25P]|nr:hypothetical protein AB670_00243 [Chryseobacterium sp. MOF25P]OBW45354.1 hypothetical protein AB671_02537 [Chryseobacterium sp. BGARF1]
MNVIQLSYLLTQGFTKEQNNCYQTLFSLLSDKSFFTYIIYIDLDLNKLGYELNFQLLRSDIFVEK